VDEENDGEEEDELSGKEEEGLALRCAVCRQNYSLACVFSRIFCQEFQIPVIRIGIDFNADPDPVPAY
jgi:hypothetical protein